MRHIHADIIHAYAEGSEVQLFDDLVMKWKDISTPTFFPSCKYRVKPVPKPDIVRYVNIYPNSDIGSCWDTLEECQRHIGPIGVIKYTIDGKSLKLKSVEIV